MKNFNKVGNCDICEGNIIIVKEPKFNILLVMCDECQSEWNSPEDFLSGKPVITDEHEKVVDASIQEIINNGWDKYIRKDI